MSIYRSYLKKGNTLIQNTLNNNSQNPVTEISYGTTNKTVSRYIFDIDLDILRNRFTTGLMNPNSIVKHILHMTNTISYAPQYLGRKSYSLGIDRASSFDLNIFNVNEDWDEGSGYEFIYPNTLQIYDDVLNPTLFNQASNWIERKTNTGWTTAGAYTSGVTQIIGVQRFEKGNENIDIDITSYINQRLFGTGYTGTTSYTGSSFGLGIKFTDSFEVLSNEFRQAVAFHAKDTNTFYEPYVETIVGDMIVDDRNYFYMDKDNELYLYSNIGGNSQNIVVNQVNIYDHEDNLIQTLSGNSIINISNGVFKIKLNIDSTIYPDSVLFTDEWILTINSKQYVYNSDFYLISSDNYFNFDQSNQINLDNYYFYYYGISEKESVKAGDIRKIKLSIKEMYPNQNNFLPLDIEYRLFTTVGKKYEIDIIPFTPVSRTNNGYEFNLDTSWLIPQDYFIQIRLKNGNYFENKQTVSFTVVSDDIIKV